MKKLKMLNTCYLLFALATGVYADLYKILDVSSSADSGEIKRAYRKQSLLYHPDKNPGTMSITNCLV